MLPALLLLVSAQATQALSGPLVRVDRYTSLSMPVLYIQSSAGTTPVVLSGGSSCAAGQTVADAELELMLDAFAHGRTVNVIALYDSGYPCFYNASF